jgi:3-hydroxyacyl-[acyl-carrier-protein] dehydratase
VTAAAGPVRRDVASPLLAPVRAAGAGPGRAASRFPVDPAEPLLAGHYPGFAIFPGVCLLECAHRTALAALDRPARLTGIESARFLGPVFPGDTVHTDVDAEAVDGGWLCRARLAAAGSAAAGPGGAGPGGGGRREVAVVRLRYAPAAGPA